MSQLPYEPRPLFSSPPSASSRALLFVGVGCGLTAVLFLVGIVAVVVYFALLPPPYQSGAELSAEDRTSFEETGLLEPDETIIYAFTEGTSGFRTRTSFFTTRRVAMAHRIDDPDTIESATYDQIADMQLQIVGSFFEPSVIGITRVDGTRFFLFVESFEQHDRQFFNRMNREWLQQRRPPSDAPSLPAVQPLSPPNEPTH